MGTILVRQHTTVSSDEFLEQERRMVPSGWVIDVRMETLLDSVVLIDLQPTEPA